MDTDLIVFFVLAVIAIGSAFGLLLSRQAIYAALFLVLNFITVAIFYLLLGAPFIALSQVTVYAGAIMVLFLFVIMLLGTEILPPPRVLRWQRLLGWSLGALLAAEVVYWFIFRGVFTQTVTSPPPVLNSMEVVQEMSIKLFNQYLLPFEVTSILLLVAMIGAITLTKKEKGGQR
jgi:NADH-quinone oxidoreductase subunit J